MELTGIEPEPLQSESPITSSLLYPDTLIVHVLKHFHSVLFPRGDRTSNNDLTCISSTIRPRGTGTTLPFVNVTLYF
jgi:hypothetical protein